MENSVVYMPDVILEGYQASEIMNDEKLSSAHDAAAYYFKNIVCDGEIEESYMPEYYDFICDISEICGKMYYDFGADYYFVVLDKDSDIVRNYIDNK